MVFSLDVISQENADKDRHDIEYIPNIAIREDNISFFS